MTPTQEYLKAIFEYNPVDGVVRWNICRSNMVKGARAGCINKSGYIVVTVDSKTYRLTRLIWIYMFGHIPDDFHVDHINGNKIDNRLCNLRLVTNKQNQENRPAPRNTSSGYRGVTWHKACSKWMARICHHGKRETIGFFETADDAYSAYKQRASELYSHTDRLP
ncbi:MAG: HNH endonuclease [Micrococcales bacterium]|nr:HNH endonuclease [Micrococcales bacterium]